MADSFSSRYILFLFFVLNPGVFFYYKDLWCIPQKVEVGICEVAVANQIWNSPSILIF